MIRLRILGGTLFQISATDIPDCARFVCYGLSSTKAREDQGAASAPIWTSRMDVSAGEINSGDRRRLMLLFDLALGTNLREFAVQFRSDQQGEACPIQPGH
jgi:hypothetical protein